jgi:RHS repeat-associated protein
MAKANPIRFSSKYHDDETDLLYYVYRYYNAGMERWINRDPISEAGGLNIYAFVNNSPITYFDLLGRLTARCPARVHLHIGIDEGDVVSHYGAAFASGDWKLILQPAKTTRNARGQITPVPIDWGNLKKCVEASLGKSCIERITIGGHGNMGDVAGGLLTSKTIKDDDPNTFTDFLKFLSGKMCSEGKSIELQVCSCAKNPVGRTFIVDLANYMNSPVTGYDAPYGPWAHGGEWLATPGVPAPILVGQHSDYNGSITQMLLDTRGWARYWLRRTSFGRIR